MIIKEKPEDFIVTELLPKGFIKKKGKYYVYKLIKKGVTTQYCLNKIGKCGYCGLKDKRAITTQYITTKKQLNIKDNHFKLELVGMSKEQLGRGKNKGNHFKIRIKINKEEEELIKNNIKRVEKGFINYYGPQRSKELINKSFGYYYEKNDYKNALLRYYINKSRSANKKLKKAYRDCFKHWGNNKYCYNRLKGIEKNIIIRPLRVNDYKQAIKLIPKNEVELMLAGYQSLKWNELASKSKSKYVNLPKIKGLKRRGKRLRVIKTKIKAEFRNEEAILEFTLPSGSYATTLIRELMKSKE